MALTRKMLKGMGLSDEQIDTIIEGHDETVTALKNERDGYKAEAEKAGTYKRERDEAQTALDAAKGDTDWKAEYDRLKADTEARETGRRVKDAYRQLLKAEKVDDDMLDSVMDVTKFDDMKLDKDGALKDADKLAEGIRSRWAKFIVTEGTRAPLTKTPPTGGKTTRTKEEIMGIKDTAERQKAIAENHELFGF